MAMGRLATCVAMARAKSCFEATRSHGWLAMRPASQAAATLPWIAAILINLWASCQILHFTPISETACHVCGILAQPEAQLPMLQLQFPFDVVQSVVFCPMHALADGHSSECHGFNPDPAATPLCLAHLPPWARSCMWIKPWEKDPSSSSRLVDMLHSLKKQVDHAMADSIQHWQYYSHRDGSRYHGRLKCLLYPLQHVPIPVSHVGYPYLWSCLCLHAAPCCAPAPMLQTTCTSVYSMPFKQVTHIAIHELNIMSTLPNVEILKVILQ